MLADNGFGDLVPIDDPYPREPNIIKLFTRVDGQLVSFHSDAETHEHGIFAVRQALHHQWDRKHGRYLEGPVLALIEGRP